MRVVRGSAWDRTTCTGITSEPISFGGHSLNADVTAASNTLHSSRTIGLSKLSLRESSTAGYDGKFSAAANSGCDAV